METPDVMGYKCNDGSCPVRIKFEYEKFNDKQIDIIIDQSSNVCLNMKINVKDEYSIKG